MKKIGIVLAALVIATFMVGTAVAIQPIPTPTQEQYFTEKSSVQGTGNFSIMKQILDKAIAIEVYELIEGYGDFCMESKEILNESATNASVQENYEHHKMIQFGPDVNDVGFMIGFESYSSPSFHGGTGAKVEEFFGVRAMQKMEDVSIYTTATEGQMQVLDFDTCDVFEGMWGTSAEWKKPCKKKIELEQLFEGDFAVQKRLLFEEDVVPCEEKDCC